LIKKTLKDHFEDIEKVEQVPDMWSWLTDEDGFIDRLYEDTW
jgi:hypothetical protein